MTVVAYVSPLCGFLTFTQYSDIVERTDSVDGLVRFVRWKDTGEGGES